MFAIIFGYYWNGQIADNDEIRSNTIASIRRTVEMIILFANDFPGDDDDDDDDDDCYHCHVM